MYLLINTSERDQINLALFNEDVIEHKSYSGQNRELLFCINKLSTSKLGTLSFELKTLKGIMVVIGAGSFTNTRVACVVANTFAYILQIPLLAIKKEQVQDVQKLITKLLKQKPGHYLSATYSGEPNIRSK